MEQLYLPNDAPMRDKLVKYDGYTDFYEGDFFDYPKQHGCDFLLEQHGGIQPQKLQEWYKQGDGHCSSFLQTWLFCKLIYEFLGPSYRHAEFVKINEKSTGPVFCTSTLVDRLKMWGGAMQLASTDIKSLLYDHLSKCFRTATAVLATARGKLPVEALQVICVTIETIQQVVQRALASANQEFIKQGGWPQSSWGEVCPWTQDDVKRMVSLGWCKAGAYRTLNSVRSVQSRMYLSNLSRQEQANLHKVCERDICVAWDNITIPRHRSETCKCDVLKFKDIHLQDVKTFLADGRMYVLELDIDMNDHLTMKPVTWDNEQSYVAISHVWKDGMGNPDENALPECQMRFVYQSTLQTGVFRSEATAVRVWIDTICCPVEISGKRIVLSRMREIYEKARRVLDLDSELQKVHAFKDRDSTEMMARVLHSNWTTRLWTLQESFLAQELVFCVAEGVVSLEQFACTDEHTVKPTHHAIIKHLKIQYQTQRNFGHNELNRTKRQMSFLKRSLSERNVTSAEDEALCLATLVDLPSHAIQTIVHSNDRMVLFWEEYCRFKKSLPLSLLFFLGPKIDKEGLRWAPRSLLQASKFMNPVLESNYEEAQTQGQISLTGLCFRSQGCLIKPQNADRDLERLWSLQPQHTGRTSSCFLRDNVGKWYQMTDMDSTSKITTPGDQLVPGTIDVQYIEQHPEGALRAQIQAALVQQKEYCVLFANHLTCLGTAGTARPAIFSLLCDTIGSANQEQRGRPSRIVLMSPVDVQNSVIWEYALKITENFRSTSEQYASYRSQPMQDQNPDSEASRDEIATELTNKFYKFVYDIVEQTNELKAYANGESDENAAFIRVLHAAREMLANCFHFDIEILPESQQWCIG